MRKRRMIRGSILTIAMAVGLSAATARAQVFERYAVACQEGNAAEAGREALRAGGSAVDAAVATAFALAVTHPAAGNIGGGGFIVSWTAETKTAQTFDFRETAPLGASPTMYLDAEGRLKARHRAGPLAAGVPGTVKGLALAHEKLGRRPWKTLVEPAVRLARDGFAISDTLARSLNSQLGRAAGGSGVAEDLSTRDDRLGDFPASVAAYGKKDGTSWREGDVLIQPDLAATLQRIADDGADGFYRGRTAELIEAYMKEGGGIITAKDLQAYVAKERPAVHGTYRGNDIYTMGPPASGGLIVLMALNQLEGFDLRADGRESGRTVHRVTEAMRRAFFIRATRIADPDFETVPTEELASKAFGAELARTIGEEATPSRSLADFPIVDGEGANTTHLSVVDGEGNAVALTYTLEEGYGSKAVVPGAGFLLNNEMGDFNLRPGRTDTSGSIGTAPNRIAPGKRMLSSQAPTVVVRDGRVRLVTGSPGGRTIPNTVLWVVLNVLEFGLEPRAAVDAARTHHQWFPDRLVLEGDAWPESVRKDLAARGHALGRFSVQGDAHTIALDPADGRLEGIPDLRRKTSRAAGD
jgi:gamma-glutamyltranspeptidase/glutathione hydrolase